MTNFAGEEIKALMLPNIINLAKNEEILNWLSEGKFFILRDIRDF